MTEPDTASLLLTRIVIERRLGDDGDSVTAEFADNNGDQPGLVEILGMLELTKDTAIRAAMGEAGCDCEDCDDEDDEP